MAIYGYTKNYKLIKPGYDSDTWHDYEYDNLDTIDAVLSAIYASGNWKGFWAANTAYVVGDVVIDRDTDTMYKVMVEHTTSAGSFAAEQIAHPDYYELWSPNNLAESWATKTDGKVSNEDYSAKAYAISSGLIDEGSAKEWAISSGEIGNTNEYSAKKYATDAHNDYISMTTNPNVAAVGSNINNVNAVGQSISNVNTVASNVSSVNIVAGVSTNVTTVAGISTDVSTVANNDANITTVATNISDVNTAATNIEAIKNAPTAAANAANSATDSANSATTASASAQAAQDALNDVQGLIATPIGTIFQSVYVDESLDIARQLNGQLISSTKFTGFRGWLNTVQTAIPNLFTTEVNWQAEKTNSKLGQCGKFVVDDTAGTIRLPCVVNAQGLADLALIGNLVNESLPNITGDASLGSGTVYGLINSDATPPSGAFKRGTASAPNTVNQGTSSPSASSFALGLDASRSSSTYQDNAPVQQEAVQYPYYIQVATGVEETLPAIREYQVNNSDYFGKSMYSDVAPDNASWLVSNGQWNAKTVYPDYYDWLLEKRNSNTKTFYLWKNLAGDTILFLTETNTLSVGSALYGYNPTIKFGEITAISGNNVTFRNDVANTTATVSINLSNPTYAGNIPVYYSSKMNVISKENLDNWNIPTNTSDYDFVVNTENQTFRLPLLNGSEDLISDRYDDLGVDTSKSTWNFVAPATGFVSASVQFKDQSTYFQIRNVTKEYHFQTPAITASGYQGNLLPVEKGDSYLIAWSSTPPTKIYWARFYYAKGNGSLYYYVGDTVQDASLINAGAVLGQLSNKADIDASNFNADGKSLLSGLGMPSSRYIDLTLGASGSTYTAPANGYFRFAGLNAQNSARKLIINNTTSSLYANQSGNVVVGSYGGIFIPALKGDSVVVEYSGYTSYEFRFVYAEGEN